jgi:hypothetical protein
LAWLNITAEYSTKNGALKELLHCGNCDQLFGAVVVEALSKLPEASFRYWSSSNLANGEMKLTTE